MHVAARFARNSPSRITVCTGRYHRIVRKLASRSRSELEDRPLVRDISTAVLLMYRVFCLENNEALSPRRSKLQAASLRSPGPHVVELVRRRLVTHANQPMSERWSRGKMSISRAGCTDKTASKTSKQWHKAGVLTLCPLNVSIL